MEKKAKISELKNSIERIDKLVSLYNSMAEKAKEGVSRRDADELKERMKLVKQEILKTTLFTKETIKELKTKELP